MTEINWNNRPRFGELPEDEAVALFRNWWRGHRIQFEGNYGDWHFTTYPQWHPNIRYRCVPTKDMIPWQVLDEQWQWASRDADGYIHLWAAKPEISERTQAWRWTEGDYTQIDGLVKGIVVGTCDWKDSLQRRPEGV